MMWNYEQFKQKLKNDKKKSKRLIYSNYVKLYGDNPTIESEPFYTEYLSKFKPQAYNVNPHLENVFDWDLLLKLTAASFSSDWELTLGENETIPELIFTVRSGNQSISKTLTSLFCMQVFRMYNIYVSEQMSLAVMFDDEFERQAIEAERLMRISKYQNRISEIKILAEYKYDEQKISKRVSELLK